MRLTHHRHRLMATRFTQHGHGPHRFGPAHVHGRGCDCSIEALEEHQRDLEEAVADLAAVIKRRKAAEPQ